MLIVVSYDVPNDRRRTRLAHALKDFGERVQYSVFECRLDAPSLEKLSRRVKALIDPEEDRVRIYRLCLDCERQVEIQGAGHDIAYYQRNKCDERHSKTDLEGQSVQIFSTPDLVRESRGGRRAGASPRFLA